MELTIEAIEELLNRKLEPLVKEIQTLQAGVVVLTTDVGTLKTDVGTLKTDVGVLKRDVGALKRGFRNLEGEVARIDRSVKAIESFPVPYGRPKTYHSATELHSVTMPVRIRQGYQG